FEDVLSAPVTREFTTSLGAELGRGYVKGSYVWRNVSHYGEDFVTLDNGATDVTFEGTDFCSFQNCKCRNTDDIERRYQALVFQGRLNLTRGWALYANSTVQIENAGTFEGEDVNQPAISSVFGDY